MIEIGQKYKSVNWPECSLIEIKNVSDGLVYHTRILTNTGFIHNWKTYIDVFQSDIDNGNLVLVS